MKPLKTALAFVLTASLTAPAFAQAPVAASSGSGATTQTAMKSPSRKATLMMGSALFVGGFTVGAYSFLNNKNGKYAEFGEASARNVKLGSTGLGLAFAGGLMMFMGSHAKHLPNVSAGPGGVAVSKHLSW